jgi:hypothetical protein
MNFGSLNELRDGNTCFVLHTVENPLRKRGEKNVDVPKGRMMNESYIL